MKDPTIPDAENRKKIMFYDNADRQTKLRIRCDFDGISQSQFFRMMITGYIEDDGFINSFLKKYKEKYGIQGQQKRDKISQIQKETLSTCRKFALDNNEIENIFDILEREAEL